MVNYLKLPTQSAVLYVYGTETIITAKLPNYSKVEEETIKKHD